MPKIDTLDALGNAMTIIFIKILTTNHATDMSNKCPINAQLMPQICPRYPYCVPKLVRRNAHYMPKLCQRFA